MHTSYKHEEGNYQMNKKKLQRFKKILTEQLEMLQDKSSQTRVTALAESEQISDFTDQATLEPDVQLPVSRAESTAMRTVPSMAWTAEAGESMV